MGTKTSRFSYFGSLRLQKSSLLFLLLLIFSQSSSGKTVFENLEDFRERIELIRKEAKTLSSFFIDLSFDAPSIVRDSAVRVGSILEKHFRKLQQNCEELELMANKSKSVSKHYPVEFFPAERLLDYNLTLIYSRR